MQDFLQTVDNFQSEVSTLLTVVAVGLFGGLRGRRNAESAAGPQEGTDTGSAATAQEG